jgi:hypothetical protein
MTLVAPCSILYYVQPPKSWLMSTSQQTYLVSKCFEFILINMKSYIPANKVATSTYYSGQGPTPPCNKLPLQPADRQQYSTRPPSTSVPELVSGFGGNQCYKYICPKMSLVSVSMNSFSGGLQKWVNVCQLKIEPIRCEMSKNFPDIPHYLKQVRFIKQAEPNVTFRLQSYFNMFRCDAWFLVLMGGKEVSESKIHITIEYLINLLTSTLKIRNFRETVPDVQMTN